MLDPPSCPMGNYGGQGVGVLECWSVGVLECWSVGVLECCENILF